MSAGAARVWCQPPCAHAERLAWHGEASSGRAEALKALPQFASLVPSTRHEAAVGSNSASADASDTPLGAES